MNQNLSIYDAIKQNESELEKTLKKLSINVCPISELYHAGNPINIERTVPEI